MPVFRSAGIIPYIEDEGTIKYLLIKSSGDGDWGFPKGHLEPGEKGIDAAIRETYEETGLNIQIQDLVPKFKETISYFVHYDYNTQPPEKLRKPAPKFVVYFLGEAPSKNVKLRPNPETGITEHKFFVWLPFEEAVNKLSYNKELLEKSNQHLLSKETKLTEILKKI
jgi:8-oxo-dGTP pyrophosphatase MutT (NUDIX family)